VHRITIIATAAMTALLLGATSASAHQGNPNMESVVRAIVPRTSGVSIQVLNRDDRFELTNRSGQPIVIYGYNREPYARLLPDGTVVQNASSPAYYLNQDRLADVAVPASASATAPPTWKVLDKTGRFQWHDHRMHYMGLGVPASVKDTAKRQKVFDYTIPLKVGDRAGAIDGTLLWTPQSSGGPPVGAIVGLVVLVLAGVGAVVVKRRRRADAAPDEHDEASGRPDAVEAW
jgi:hypothetical protein